MVVAIIVVSGLLDFVEKYNYNSQKINRIYKFSYLKVTKIINLNMDLKLDFRSKLKILKNVFYQKNKKMLKF